MMLDILIKNGTVIDGTGKVGFYGSIGISGERLVAVTGNEEAQQVIDAAGKYICPGFIDAHSHGDLTLGEEYAKLCKTSQGITTEVTGQCSFSMAPIDPDKLELTQQMLKAGTLYFPEDMKNWTSYQRYIEYVEMRPKTTNLTMLVGHSALRIAVMGFANRVATEDELERMKALLKDAMEHGAAGLSTGLIYTPCCYSATREVIELVKVIKPYGGIYTSHIRNESYDILNAVEEVLSVGRETGVPVCISHHKVMGKPNWALQRQTLELIDRATTEGLCITCDQYPYTWNQTGLNIIIPPSYFNHGVEAMAKLLEDPAMRETIKREIEDPSTKYDNFYLNAGGWDGIIVTGSTKTPQAEGKRISAFAEELGKDPWETYFDILCENKGDGSAIFNTIKDENLFDVIRNPNSVVGSDGLIRSFEEKGHPRAYATMPHAINYYVRENHILTLEAMIRKMTSLPCERLGIRNKGILAPGYDADVLVLDYDHLVDHASYTSPNELTDGIDYVIVGGQVVWKDKRLTGAAPGKFLPHNR